jgi:hypothetical protein
MHRENTSEHPPKNSDKPAAKPVLHWRRRKVIVAARKQAADEAANVRPQLIEAHVQRLGGAVGPLVMADIERVVDLTLLASKTRTAVLQGTANVREVTLIEGALGKALRRLDDMPVANASPAVRSLSDYLVAGDGEG